MLTLSLCLFAHFQEKKGISDEWMAEITAMKSRLDRFEQFGLIDRAASVIIIRNSNSSSSTSTSSIGNIVANIEIDGPHHRQQHKQYFTSLRDSIIMDSLC